MRLRTLSRSLLVASFALLIIRPAHAQAAQLERGERFTVTVRRAFSPFESVQLRVSNRAGALWATLSRLAAGQRERALDASMIPPPTGITRADLERLIRRADPPPAPAPDSTEYTVSLYTGGETREARWVHPEDASAHLDELRLLFTWLKQVEARTGVPVYKDPFGDPTRQGSLDLSSVPQAQVTLDGLDIGQRTPLTGYPLDAGEHVLVLKNTARGIERRYTFKIEPGMTTVLDLNLE